MTDFAIFVYDLTTDSKNALFIHEGVTFQCHSVPLFRISGTTSVSDILFEKDHQYKVVVKTLPLPDSYWSDYSLSSPNNTFFRFNVVRPNTVFILYQNFFMIYSESEYQSNSGCPLPYEQATLFIGEIMTRNSWHNLMGVNDFHMVEEDPEGNVFRYADDFDY